MLGEMYPNILLMIIDKVGNLCENGTMRKNNEKSTVYIVHGYTSSSKDEWFPWLKGKLIEKGINVIVFDMPNSNSPIVTEWDEFLGKNIDLVNESTYFVGHSLGCVTLLRYFNNQNCETKIGGAILVSGFICQNPKYPFMDSFVNKNLDIEKIIGMVKNRCVISSPNDIYVPYEFSCELAKRFDAELLTIKNGGHFIGQEGYFKFPQVFDEIMKMTNK